MSGWKSLLTQAPQKFVVQFQSLLAGIQQVHAPDPDQAVSLEAAEADAGFKRCFRAEGEG